MKNNRILSNIVLPDMFCQCCRFRAMVYFNLECLEAGVRWAAHIYIVVCGIMEG
jgi:hypothetical protein